MSPSGEQLDAIAFGIWAFATIVAFLGGAWLRGQLRGQEDLELAERLANKEISLEAYRAEVTRIQP